MTIKNPNAWKSIAAELSQSIGEGTSVGEAVRVVYAKNKCGTLLLSRAIQEACAVSSREAAAILAHEISLPQIEDLS